MVNNWIDMKVERMGCLTGDSMVTDNEDGDYVLYEDYKKLYDKYVKLEETLGKIIRVSNSINIEIDDTKIHNNR